MSSGTLKRTDEHRPSVIDVADYEFVGVEVMKDEADMVGASLMMAEEHKRMRRHQEQTGATFSKHQHGGNCHICGAHAVYTVRWHHVPTNTYIRTGEDCADKLWSGSPEGFRAIGAKIDAARNTAKGVREAKAGKQKAELILKDAGLFRAWELFTADDETLVELGAVTTRTRHIDACCECGNLVGIGYPHAHDCLPNAGTEKQEFTDHLRSWEYQTLVDIVGKLVKYGSISEKQEKFVGKLVEKIDNAKAIAEEQEAKKAAEREAAEDAPEGRVQITGRLVSLKETCSQWGVTTKGLIVDDRGFKVWGTIPAAILDQIAANLDEHERRVIVWNGESKGRPAEGLTIRVELTGTVKRSDTDRQFGFYSRPAKASCEILEQDAK